MEQRDDCVLPDGALEYMMDEKLIEEFKNPGADKHSFPFWGWNALLDESEIRRQIREMKQAGVGGFFIHSRDGLETEYLGAEWLKCVRAAVDEAKKQGMYAWLYDEDRWPSGTAGGRVTAQGDEYRCKGLTLEVLPMSAYASLYTEEIEPWMQAEGQPEEKEWGNEPTVLPDNRKGLLAVWRAVIDGDAVKRYEILSLKKMDELIKDRSCAGNNDRKEKEVLLVVRLEVSAPSEWFNWEAPPDNLNPDCAEKFIEETHEWYKRAVGDEFGKTVPGIFTDEPSLHDRHACFGDKKSWIPWTYGYREYFKAAAGYDFFELLPEFYFEAEASRKIHHDYWHSIARRYGESYFKVLGEWCEKNRLLFTGHFLQEDKLGTSVRVNGAVMPNYQYQHIPGIDMLCEQTGEYMTVKQCTSVASQLGKKQVLSETYGCTGWDFTFEGQKWIGDWQFVLGVNRRCQHLALYSLRGCRKRDYPPSFNYNTTWWRENKVVDDYFARLSVVLGQGEAVRSIVLVHPVTTAWARLGVNPYGNPVRRLERDIPAINEIGESFNSLIEYLEREHLDCDLGDELLISEYGTADGGSFVIGRAAYCAVVLPPVDTLLASTCEKLLAYMGQGGFVYALQSLPYMAEGSEAAWEKYRTITQHPHWIAVNTREELADRLKPYRTVRIQESGQLSGRECTDILYQLRKTGDDYILFLVNNNRMQGRSVTVKVPFAARPVQMELLSGKIEETICCRYADEGTELSAELAPTGSAVYYLETGEKVCQDVRKCAGASEAEGERSETVVTRFSYRLDHENVLPLDSCCYRMDGGDWSEIMEVWQAQRQIRERLRMRQIDRNGLEQRYKWAFCRHPSDGHRVELAFPFEAEEVVNKASLVVERLSEFSITLNGQKVKNRKKGWFLDRELEVCALPALCAGRNLLTLSCCYTDSMELENCYLAGVFGVDKGRRLTAQPQLLSAGDWTEQGLKHYCGNVTYLLEYEHVPGKIQKGQQTVLRLPETKAVYVKISVNGHERMLPWNYTQPVSIGEWLLPGKNTIAIEVAGSPRNMLGPFHLKKKPYHTNDAAFTPPEAEYHPEYLLASYGMLGGVAIAVE